MTHKENITAILECHFTGFKKEIIDSACNRILEQEPCDDLISRHGVLDTIFGSRNNFYNEFDQGFFADKIRALPPVTPQPKMGCEGCIYKKNGNLLNISM